MKCANCGRADLMQTQITNYQCLACGALTSMATGKVVTGGPQPPKVSAVGAVVVELSNGIVQTDIIGADRRDRPNGGPEPEPDVAGPEPRPARVDEGYILADPNIVPAAVTPTVSSTPVPVSTAGTFTTTSTSPPPAPVNFSALTPEQIAAIEAIAHPTGA
jgi:hypothetical protein